MPILDSKGDLLQAPTDVIYGGTFDPPHEGHRRVVERVLEKFPTVRVRIIPAAAPAGAYGQHKQPHASFEHRQAMCELLLGDLAVVDGIEATLARPNYSLRTLEALDKQYPGRSWALVVGRDQLESFAAWYQPERVVAKASLLVIERETAGNLADELSLIGQKIGFQALPLSAESWRWQGLQTGIFSLGTAVSAAASRLIRDNIEQALAQGWLRPDIYQYIKRHGLYTERGA